MPFLLLFLLSTRPMPDCVVKPRSEPCELPCVTFRVSVCVCALSILLALIVFLCRTVDVDDLISVASERWPDVWTPSLCPLSPLSPLSPSPTSRWWRPRTCFTWSRSTPRTGRSLVSSTPPRSVLHLEVIEIVVAHLLRGANSLKVSKMWHRELDQQQMNGVFSWSTF